jgi:hypothetical protein
MFSNLTNKIAHKIAQGVIDRVGTQLNGMPASAPTWAERGYTVMPIDNGYIVRSISFTLGSPTRVMYCKDLADIGTTLTTMLAADKVLGGQAQAFESSKGSGSPVTLNRR